MLADNRSERAILVVDLINKYAHRDGSNFEPGLLDVIPYVQGELQYFRERSRLVIFANTTFVKENGNEIEEFDEQIFQALSPRSGEITLKKPRPNAFFNTNFLETLNDHKIKNLTIVGAFSHASVIMTAMSALDNGFTVVVPETCVFGQDQRDHLAALQLINLWLNN